MHRNREAVTPRSAAVPTRATGTSIMRLPRSPAILAGFLCAAPLSASAQSTGAPSAPVRETAAVPPAPALTRATTSALRDAVDRFGADRAALQRRYDLPYSTHRRERMRSFYTGWSERLRDIDFAQLDQDARIDYVLLRNELTYQLALLDREHEHAAQMAPLLPFADSLLELQQARRELTGLDPAAAAAALAHLAAQIDATRRAVEAGAAPASGAARTAAASDPAPIRTTRIVAFRTASVVNDLRQTLQRWNRFYSGYDPLFNWWAAEPYRRADAALEAYAKTLRERIVGIRAGEDEPIIGDPIGARGLESDLAHELIPYTAAELVRIAEREFAWCEAEMRRAARDMGFGDDWRAALEKVKTLYVEPGEQTALTTRLAREAVEFVTSRDLVTVPPLAQEIWRMEMLSPEQQKVAPFYLGGEVIQVAFPTDAMTHEDKLMAMRGNNVHFSRAVVHHELIPGHHLQGYMTARYNVHRRAFSTPFWTEGWALYWEMLLWDLGFPATPEDRVGMLFWRMHRAARIIFSLNVHLGTMTPEQAIDFLVERVGHERANATAEVRRSMNGTYPPLYQAAYMLGGLQFRALHAELVGSGRMSNRDFHDAILQGGSIPVELVRARLMNTPLTRDYAAQWRFGDTL
jgi:uncharacterized protein (DUF885 family)